MIALLIVLCFVLFAVASLAVAWALVERGGHATTKRVGKWYQDRVAELENETRQLAEQVVATGAVVRHAMPVPPGDDGAEYAYDPTGLVREKLDPRDLPVG